MIATNGDDVTAALDFCDRIRKLRPEAAREADNLRVAAADLRGDIARLVTFPDAISAGEFAELRCRISALLDASATCLENSATLLATLADIRMPRVRRK